MNWHRIEISQLYSLMNSKPDGLSTSEANERLLQIGRNQLEEGKRKTAISIFLSQFKDVMILILLAAAIISGFIGDISDTIVILVIVALNAAVGYFQEYRAEKALQALKQMTITQAKVLRDGNTILLSAAEIVPGDIVILEAGSAVAADLRIIESRNLKLEEAALTGESNPVDKVSTSIEVDDVPIGDRKNMAYKGTFVTYGRGSGMVVATGMQTELGGIAKMLSHNDALSPLQQRMASFAKMLSLLIGFLCIIFLLAGLFRGEDLVKMVLTSISLAVAAIPEALPAVITISLALAAKRMVRHNTLVRKLSAVETLGSVTYICTDKTGTLTLNKMHVECLYVNGSIYRRSEIEERKDENDIYLFLSAMALNNDAVINGQKIIGESTEAALLEVALESGVHADHTQRLLEISFDSDRKLMTTFHVWKDKIISFTKGAPDIVIERCKNVNRHLLLTELNAMASQGLRVLGFAYRIWDRLPVENESNHIENNLVFLGFAGMIDPPRPEVSEAVQQCKSAGIVPVMITGDHPLTAKVIAERIGIIQDAGDLMITGGELARLDRDEFLTKVEKIRVYARVSPDQKLYIVKTLQQRGHFVAMTGDGVNDAPSLKMANIGIAMGITGTDVSKEAAHMILLDDNFSTIVRAVKEGRRIYDNILKFIKYLMTTNSGELWTLLLGPIIGLPIALLPIHILWINLISDGFPAIALSFERAEKNIMKRPPRRPDESVFANGRGIHIIWVGLLIAGITLIVQAFAITNNLHWQTIVFNVLCLSQMAHVLAIRSESDSLFRQGIFSNRPLMASVILSVLLQAVVTYIPFFQLIFKTQHLTLAEFLGVGIVSSLVFWAVEIEKNVSRRKKRKQS